MKENGFTLVEMLTVIIILISISLIVTFSITNIVKKSTNDLSKIQMESVKDAARTYAIKNSSTLSDNNEITLCDLKREGLLPDDFKDPSTEQLFDDSLIVTITKNKETNEYNFEFDAIKKMENYYCDKSLSIILNGNSPYYLTYGDTYLEKSIKVNNTNVSCSENVTSGNTTCKTTCKDGNTSQVISCQNVGHQIKNYKVEYEIKYNKDSETYKTTLTRNVIVSDKTSPKISIGYNGSIYTKPFTVRLLEGDYVDASDFSCSVTDNNDNNLSCKRSGSWNFSTLVPGTYDLIYSTVDSNGNTDNFVVTIIVVAKNKNLLGSVITNGNTWTNTKETLKIVPLYSKYSCNNFKYTFNGIDWISENELDFTTNGKYKLGIRYDCNSIPFSNDYFEYEIKNIDVVPPDISNIDVEIAGSTYNEVIDGVKYYFGNNDISIGTLTGVKDLESGIANRIVYINDELMTNNVLTEQGIYEISGEVYDLAGNKSEKEKIAVVVILKEKPTCDFYRCGSTLPCPLHANEIITGDINYTSQFFFNGDFSTPKNINFRLQCSFPYIIDFDATINTDIFPANFSLGDTIGSINNVSKDTASVVTNCNGNICTKKYDYWINTNISRFKYGYISYSQLDLFGNNVCDKLGNCSNSATSMEIWQ